MVGPPTATPKLVKGLWLLIRTENMLDHEVVVLVSIISFSCHFWNRMYDL